MKHKTRLVLLLAFALTSPWFLIGCGGSTETTISDSEQSSPQSESGEAYGLTPASISVTSNNTDFASPALGSPEQLLQEIADETADVPPMNSSAEQIDQFRRTQAKTIVDLSTKVIAETHDNEAQEDIFNKAVTHLMSARLELALQGDKNDIQALYDDCSILYERAPESKAAAEAAYVVAKFAHTNAKLYGQKDARWLKEFSNRARLFASHFPNEVARSVQLLYFAGWSCELHGLNDDAISCYTLIQEKFPDSPRAAQVSGIMRRLRLKGQRLQLAGNTIDGGFVSVDEYAGKIVLVTFWDSQNENFQKQLAQLNNTIKKYEKHGLQVLGVNLDKDETDVEKFLEQHSLKWSNIFYADMKQRRWGNPVVQYYGVRDIPEMWLVNQQGVVVETKVTPENLESQVRKLLNTNSTAALSR